MNITFLKKQTLFSLILCAVTLAIASTSALSLVDTKRKCAKYAYNYTQLEKEINATRDTQKALQLKIAALESPQQLRLLARSDLGTTAPQQKVTVRNHSIRQLNSNSKFKELASNTSARYR